MSYETVAQRLRDAKNLRELNAAAQSIQHAPSGDIERLNALYAKRQQELK